MDTTPFFLSGHTISDCPGLWADQDNNDPHAYVYAVGISAALGGYLQANVSNLETALTSFISVIGYPWIAVGAVSAMPWANGTKGPIAVNLAYSGFSFSDGSTGIDFAGIQGTSFGYAPWPNFAEAQAALQAMVRNFTWTPAS